MPLPVDPTQPGVEILFLQWRPPESGKAYGILGIKAPAGTIFYAPFDGHYVLSYWCDPDCDKSLREPGVREEPLDYSYFLAESSRLTAADFDPSVWDRLIHPYRGNDFIGIRLTMGDVHFTLKTDDLAEFPWRGLRDDPGVQVFILTSVGPGPDRRHSFNEDDLLRDDQGRIVFIKP